MTTIQTLPTKMKLSVFGLLALIAFGTLGCQSAIGPKIGMTEKQWLWTTLVADVVYMEGKVKAYKSGGIYYYFHDGTLVKIDQGMIPAQKIELDVNYRGTSTSPETKSPQSKDVYDQLRKLNELKKDGILSEEEFQSQKTKLLNATK